MKAEEFMKLVSRCGYGTKASAKRYVEENPNETIGINDEWLENIFDRKIILPNDKKDSEIIKEFVEEISTGKE